MQKFSVFNKIQTCLFLDLDLDVLVIKTNGILDNLNSWFIANRFSFNYENIFYMIF